MNHAFSKIWIIVFIVGLIAGGILAWQYFEAPKEEVKAPKFEIYYSFGVFEENILDTKRNLYVKDMVCDPDLKFTVSLSENEKKEIYDTIVKNDFFNLKENMLPPLGLEVTPPSGLTLEVTTDQKTKTIKWRDGYPENDPDYLKLKNITATIDNIISQKEKEMSIPEPRCAYQ